MENDLHFFGEWVYWDNPEDLDDACKYLALWKKFILKRLSEDMQQEGEDHVILRPAGVLGRGTLGIKIAMKGKITEKPMNKYDLRNLSID